MFPIEMDDIDVYVSEGEYGNTVTFLGVLSVSYNTLFIFKNSKPGSKCKEIRADDLYIYKSH